LVVDSIYLAWIKYLFDYSTHDNQNQFQWKNSIRKTIRKKTTRCFFDPEVDEEMMDLFLEER